MTTQPRIVFVNLAVGDLPASRSFFEGLGFTFDERFTDETAACMVLSDLAYVMLLQRERFAEFTAKEVADSRTTTEVLVAVSAEDREAVDALCDKALASGGSPANEPMDAGFMYMRSFQDLDGHIWEITWMSQEAIEKGPADMAAAG